MKIEGDTRLQHNVLAELEWEPSIDASKIGVTAKAGVVTLTGWVATYVDKMTAERVAKRVYGVKAVANDVEVKVVGSAERNDGDIAAAALNALTWHARVPDDRIKVTVRRGLVTLEGDVDWGYQRDAAEQSLRNLRGVKGIVNHVKVRSRLKAGDVKNKIEAAFKRNAEIDARRIGVEARDGKVVLQGNVRSWTEHDEAQRAAWAAPGVTAVENRITVTP
jgi:osmotically-inducible protein OsmY